MDYLVFGAGQMGAAAALDLILRGGAVTLADADAARLARAARWIAAKRRAAGPAGAGRLATRRADARRADALPRLMKGHRVVVSALPYYYNLALTRAALRAGCHFCDLGGNSALVRRQLALGPQAARRGLGILPDCGLSPGLASIVGAAAVRELRRPRSLRIWIGGLPVEPRAPLDYQIVFSVEGLINEFDEPCRILRGGVPTDVAPLTEIEPLQFAGWPPLEAFMTSGGTSTLPDTFRGRLQTVEEKTIRYAGHAQVMAGLRALGFFSAKRAPGLACAPRELTARLFERAWRGQGADAVLLRVVAAGEGESITCEADIRSDSDLGLSAMARATALPLSICAQMLADGRIAGRGGLTQEEGVPAATMLAEMEKRGIRLRLARREGR